MVCWDCGDAASGSADCHQPFTQSLDGLPTGMAAGQERGRVAGTAASADS
ncbi:hypothetical protein [Streptomyces xinghaiensis]